jgi:hypothetical protein
MPAQVPALLVRNSVQCLSEAGATAAYIVLRSTLVCPWCCLCARYF